MAESSDLPANIKALADAAVDCLIPPKSRAKCMESYEHFENWRKTMKCDSLAEDVLLAYFEAQSDKGWKPSTLSARHSMIGLVLKVNNQVDIGKYSRLTAYINRLKKGYEPHKAEVFTPEQVGKFLSEAPDRTYLLTKVCKI